jgi:hypothetical protein
MSSMRISQLRNRRQAIEEITSEKELVNIVLNGLPKTLDAFAASMNTRKETHEASVVEERKPSRKTKQDKADFFL